ncbi:DinB family protein [Leekyejoonella antrihumi]|uniref:DinB family protein n=1 Tax=Leekyejoonella antrihumi TaxID=1660198 RepID=A0A563E9Z6_9MICO|nr:DinB family protein [Leekyejoonella antrihumi]TWP39031.1 DinB family protein [Leekyejoonella antrihumi]
MTTTTKPAMTSEKVSLLATLADRRQFLILTSRDLTEEQARSKPTASELCIGGIIKHVASAEDTWARFITDGTAAFGDADWTSVDFASIDVADPSTVPDFVLERMDQFVMHEDETLAHVVHRYAEAARRTEAVVAGLDSLDVRHDLPPAPWNEPGATRSARDVLLHLIGETAQHAGHADIIRETIDGQKSMG